MSASVDPRVVGRVIGDVVDIFVPPGNMSVYFGRKHVANGSDIKPSVATYISKGTNPNQGKEIVSYVGPRPQVGIHRYIIGLFKQRSQVGGKVNRLINGRPNFNTCLFARQLDLGLPVAATYFNSQEPAAKRR